MHQQGVKFATLFFPFPFFFWIFLFQKSSNSSMCGYLLYFLLFTESRGGVVCFILVWKIRIARWQFPFFIKGIRFAHRTRLHTGGHSFCSILKWSILILESRRGQQSRVTVRLSLVKKGVTAGGRLLSLPSFFFSLHVCLACRF